MAYAVIRTGGKQYRVSSGDTIKVEQLAGNPGDKVKFDEVLLAGSESGAKVGKPTLSGAFVEAEIVAHGLGDKLIAFKFRKRKRSRKKIGYRQHFTALKITGVNV